MVLRRVLVSVIGSRTSRCVFEAAYKRAIVSQSLSRLLELSGDRISDPDILRKGIFKNGLQVTNRCPCMLVELYTVCCLSAACLPSHSLWHLLYRSCTQPWDAYFFFCCNIWVSSEPHAVWHVLDGLHEQIGAMVHVFASMLGSESHAQFLRCADDADLLSGTSLGLQHWIDGMLVLVHQHGFRHGCCQD